MSIHGEKIMYHFEKHGYTMDSEIKAKTHQIRGKTAYYSPSNMTIYLESTFSHLTLRPLTDISLMDAPPEELIIVRDNNWRSLQAPTDRLVEAMLSNNLLSKKSEWIKIAQETDPIYSIYVLNEIDEAQFNRLKQAPVKKTNLLYENAISVALPENQRLIDGFSELEISEDGTPYLWAQEEHSQWRFNRPVQSGNYLFKAQLFRHFDPESNPSIKFQFLGENNLYETKLTSDNNILSVPITIEQNHSSLVLSVEDLGWIPSQFINLGEENQVFLFHSAWLEPATSN